MPDVEMTDAGDSTPGWEEVFEPKIWASRFPRSLDNVSIGWRFDGDGDDMAFLNAVQGHGRRVDAGPLPTTLYFDRAKKIPAKVRDAFMINGRLLIVSKPLEDIISEFAPHCTQFFEVNLRADAARTPSGLPNHYIFNVFGTKDALIPELSENIKKHIFIELGETEPRPGTKWSPKNNRDVVALDASALEGCDVWTDPEYESTIFFSDRLYQAIVAAGLKTYALNFAPTRVFKRV